MNNLTADQQAMLAIWQQHTYAEFVLKDADATASYDHGFGFGPALVKADQQWQGLASIGASRRETAHIL